MAGQNAESLEAIDQTAMSGAPVPPRRPIWKYAAVCVALFLLTLTLYSPVGHFDFVNFDDDVFFVENPHVRAGFTAEGLRWALFQSQELNYWTPLTWMSHLLDFQLWGLNAGGHHVSSALLHGVNAVVLFLVLSRMTGALWRSAFVAALFAWHPLNVESVAWVGERKNVLSTLFWLLTMGAYFRFVKQPRIGRYVVVMAAYVMALMSKPMVVTLPFALLLLDYWPLRRLRWERGAGRQFLLLAAEKIPMLALSVGFSIAAVITQREAGVMASMQVVSLGQRVANSLVSYVAYVFTMLWPEGLAVFYPFRAEVPVWQAAGAAGLLLGVTALAVAAGRRHPYFAVGWLWYAGTLVPVIGLVQVAAQSMADRYAYVPFIGLFIIVAWGISALVEARPRAKTAVVCGAGAALAVFVVLTARQLRVWRESTALFEHALSVTDRNWLAHNNLANMLSREGRGDEAFEHYREALRLNPGFPQAHVNLGAALQGQGRLDEALEHYRAALQLQPRYAEAHNNLASALLTQGRTEEAIAHLREALRLRPDYRQAHKTLTRALLNSGRSDEAAARLTEELRLKPEDPELHNNLGNALLAQGRLEEAVSEFKEALRLKPDQPETNYNLGNALIAMGEIDEAAKCFRDAIRFKPGFYEAHNNLGTLLKNMGRFPEAAAQFTEALGVNADGVDSLKNLGWIRAAADNAQLRNGPDAVRLTQRAVELTAERDPAALDACGAALAEVGRFDEAAKMAGKAKDLALANGPAEMATEIASRIELYQLKLPYRMAGRF